ncbi:DUF7669 domain-containing protein [Paenibacillus aurantiacus]|uniref:DUF7669 domain-containing protein n=1 Tax=Paenibacillus aurantiacus TaxID=1936118 RepID=UPI00406BC421
MRTCRDELLRATRSIVKAKGENRFTPKEAVEYMQSNNTSYAESTIRTHVVSKCCINANQNHARVFNDYERIGDGYYKVIDL